MEKVNSKFDAFIFTHIQKTAGSSMRKFLKDACLANSIDPNKVHIPGYLNLPSNKNLVQLSKIELEDIRKREVILIAEHSSYGIHKEAYLSHINRPFYTTILRHPLDRFISHYYFLIYKKKPDYNQQLDDLDQHLFMKLVRQFQNLTTAYIGGEAWFIGIDQTVTKDTLEVAKRNLLLEFQCFGIFEDMEKTIDYFSESFPSWISIEELTFPSINKRGKQRVGSMNIERQAIFEEHNSLDFELYKFAQEEFYKR